MGDIIIFYFCQNVFIFSIIFWLLTWGCEYFYKKRNHTTKKQIYECGFKSFDNLNIQININFILICVFLVLYDLEFILLIPLLFNLYNATIFNFVIFFFFLILIIVSLLYDWQMQALSWQY